MSTKTKFVPVSVRPETRQKLREIKVANPEQYRRYDDVISEMIEKE